MYTDDKMNLEKMGKAFKNLTINNENIKKLKEQEGVLKSLLNEELVKNLNIDIESKADKEFFKKFKEATEETVRKFKNALTEDTGVYYIVGIRFYRNNAELTSRDYAVYPPKIIDSIEGDYTSALLSSIYNMEEAEDRLKAGYMKQICYPVKLTDKVTTSIEDGTFFNREMHYENALKVFNSDLYINTLISTELYESLDKTNLKESIYLFLTDNAEERISSRLDEIAKEYNNRKILCNFAYEVDTCRKELYKLSAELQNTIDKYQDEEACSDKLEILMDLQNELSKTEEKMLELVLNGGLKE